jgi:hypothetical protein
LKRTSAQLVRIIDVLEISASQAIVLREQALNDAVLVLSRMSVLPFKANNVLEARTREITTLGVRSGSKD